MREEQKPKSIKYTGLNAYKVLKFLEVKNVKRRNIFANHVKIRKIFPNIEYGYYIICYYGVPSDHNKKSCVERFRVFSPEIYNKH